MVSELIWWTGFCAWVYVIYQAAFVACDIGAGLARAFSWLRWYFAMHRTHDAAIKWHRLPRLFLRVWWGTMVNTRYEWQMNCGYWRGIGAWGVYTKEDVERSKTPNDSLNGGR